MCSRLLFSAAQQPYIMICFPEYMVRKKRQYHRPDFRKKECSFIILPKNRCSSRELTTKLSIFIYTSAIYTYSYIIYACEGIRFTFMVLICKIPPGINRFYLFVRVFFYGAKVLPSFGAFLSVGAMTLPRFCFLFSDCSSQQKLDTKF